MVGVVSQSKKSSMSTLGSSRWSFRSVKSIWFRIRFSNVSYRIQQVIHTPGERERENPCLALVTSKSVSPIRMAPTIRPPFKTAFTYSTPAYYTVT